MYDKRNMKKLILYILCGLPFAGKTYLTKKIVEYTGSELISFDQLWLELEKDPNLPTPVKGDEGWRLIRGVAKERIAEVLRSNKPVLYEDTNIRLEHREELRELARQYGATSVVVYVNTPEEIRAERMKQNLVEKQRHDVELENLKTAVSQFEEPQQDENVIIYNQSMDLDEWMGLNLADKP